MSGEGRLGQIVFEFFSKLTQLVALDRIPASSLAPFKPGKDKKGRAWFNLDVDESVPLAKILDAWRQDVANPIVFEVLLQRQGEHADVVDEVVLERWVLQYVGTCTVGLGRATSDPTLSARQQAARQESGVYKRMIILLRSLCCMLPLLPAHRTSQEVALRAQGSCRVCFRVLEKADASAVAQAVFPVPQAGSQTPARGFSSPPSQQRPGSTMVAFQFQPVETQSGAVCVGLQYVQGMRLALPPTGHASRHGDYLRSTTPSSSPASSSGPHGHVAAHPHGSHDRGVPHGPSLAGARPAAPTAWSRPASAHMTASQQSQQSLHSSSARPFTGQSAAPAAREARAWEHHPLQDAAGAGAGAGRPDVGGVGPRHGESAPSRATPTAPAGPARPATPSINQPAQIQRGFVAQAGAAPPAAAPVQPQPTARSSLSANDLGQLARRQGDGEDRPLAPALPGAISKDTPPHAANDPSGLFPSSAPSPGLAARPELALAAGPLRAPAERLPAPAPPVSAPQAFPGDAPGTGGLPGGGFRAIEPASVGASSRMSSSPAAPTRGPDASPSSAGMSGHPSSGPRPPGAIDIAASWSRGSMAPTGSTPRYAYSPQLLSGAGSSPHVGSMLQMPSFGRPSSAALGRSLRSREASQASVSMGEGPPGGALQASGTPTSTASPHFRARSGARQSAVMEVDGEDAAMPFDLEDAAPHPGSTAGHARSAVAAPLAGPALVGPGGQGPAPASVHDAPRGASAVAGPGREPSSARDVSAVLRMFSEAPVGWSRAQEGPSAPAGVGGAPLLRDALKEVERYRQVAHMPPVEPSPEVTALIRGQAGAEAAQSVGGTSGAGGRTGCRAEPREVEMVQAAPPCAPPRGGGGCESEGAVDAGSPEATAAVQWGAGRGGGSSCGDSRASQGHGGGAESGSQTLDW